MKLLITSLLLVSSVFSNDFSTRYDVNVGMFGKVGYADVTLETDGNTYIMSASATTVGTAAKLTGNRAETYTSKGHIIEGQYIPDTFTKLKTTSRATREQTYTFNHETKEVKLVQKNSKWITRTEFDPMAFKLLKKEVQEHSVNESTLKTFISQDVLSTYLNMLKSCNAQNTQQELVAIGAHNDEKDVNVSFLEGLQRDEVLSLFANDIGNIYNLNVTPFDKDEKMVDILVAFDNDGLMKEAILGDVFWIGKVSAKRIYTQVGSK